MLQSEVKDCGKLVNINFVPVTAKAKLSRFLLTVLFPVLPRDAISYGNRELALRVAEVKVIITTLFTRRGGLVYDVWGFTTKFMVLSQYCSYYILKCTDAVMSQCKTMQILSTAFMTIFRAFKGNWNKCKQEHCSVEQLVALWGVVKPSYTAASDSRLLSCRSYSPGTMLLNIDDWLSARHSTIGLQIFGCTTCSCLSEIDYGHGYLKPDCIN